MKYIGKYGNVFYEDRNRLHRIGLPAHIDFYNDLDWSFDGRAHRINGSCYGAAYPHSYYSRNNYTKRSGLYGNFINLNMDRLVI